MAGRSLPTIVCSHFTTLSLSVDGSVYSWGNTEWRTHGHEDAHVPSPKKIPFLKNIRFINTSMFHSACIDDRGDLYTFGRDLEGQLSVGELILALEYSRNLKVNLPPCTQVSCGQYFTICTTEDGSVYSFGNNQNGQLGIGNFEQNQTFPQLISSMKGVEFIECGASYTFCKTLNNEIFCWGKISLVN